MCVKSSHLLVSGNKVIEPTTDYIINYHNTVDRAFVLNFYFSGFLLGRLCVSYQLDSSPCFGSDDHWQVFTQDLCCLLCSKYFQ